eukprot:7687302-Pyramimonas_sp.AAC.1
MPTMLALAERPPSSASRGLPRCFQARRAFPEGSGASSACLECHSYATISYVRGLAKECGNPTAKQT